MLAVVFVLLALATGILLFSIPHQRVHIDEAWLGEQAYWQATDGVRRSELFRGLLDYENHIYVAHKLLIYLGAVSVKLFGWHLWSLRVIPLLSGGVLILLLWFYFRRSRDEDPHLALPIAYLYIVSAPLFFRFVNLYRPEVPLAACGFGSFVLVALYARNDRVSYLLGAAALAGIGFLIHLNGIIYVLAGAVTLVWLRRWRHLIAFATLAGAISLLYFYDVVGHWDAFWYQFRSDPALDKQDLMWYAPAWRLINEHKRLFRKPEVIFASTLFLTSLWYHWKALPRQDRWIVMYGLGLLVGLGALAQGKTVAYTILLLPVSAIIVARSTSIWIARIRESPKWLSVIAIVLWAFFLVHSAFDNSVFAFTQKRDVASTNRGMAVHIPEGATVLAPLDFVFEEIGKYRIRGDEAAGWIMKLERPEVGDIHKSFSAPDYLGFASNRGIEVVIIEDQFFSRVRLSPPAIGDTVMGYTAVGRGEDPARTVLLRLDHDH